MVRALLLMIVGGLVFSAPVHAGGVGGEFEFSFTAGGGTIDDDFVTFFSLQMDSGAAGLPAIDEIRSLQLEITGLTHQTPEDLDIFLLSPSFTGDRGRILIMSDKGGATNLNGVTLVFTDGGAALPADGLAFDPMGGTFQTEGLASGLDLGFASDMFVGASGGHPLDWILVFVDDNFDPNDPVGSFESFTLSGTAVPEPVTLSLLALGALVALRRKRR